MTRYKSGASGTGVLIGDDNQRLEEEAGTNDSEEEHKELVEQPTLQSVDQSKQAAFQLLEQPKQANDDEM